MADIANLGYAVLGVSDLPQWQAFATLLGFQIGHADDQAITLRMDAYQQRIVLQRNDADDLLAAGWELDTEEQLETYAAELRARGAAVTRAGAEECSLRCVRAMYRAEDPTGFVHEFYCGPATASLQNAFRSPTLTGGGFRTGALGFGHLLVRAQDYVESTRFYTEVLRLRLSDHIREEVAPGRTMEAAFFHTRTGRHHSLATAAMPGHKRLNHLMVEVQSMNDVGLAFDRCRAAGHPIQAELGHHPNDQMFSFYVVTPSGFNLEFGWGGVVIEDSHWQPVVYDRLSDWGHRRRQPIGTHS